MARRRFFVPQVRSGQAELTGSDAEHLVRVLRAEVENVYEISDNQSLYLARVSVARKSRVVFEVVEPLESPTPALAITLLAALFKFDRFELLVEKATELGVTQIIPFESVRTERGLLQAAVKRRVRWERIALEASQQSRRARLPVISEALSFRIAIQTVGTVRILLDENPEALPIMNALPSKHGATDAALLLGPEGGWTEAERAIAIESKWIPSSLGNTILRAETAAIAGLSVLNAWAAQT